MASRANRVASLPSSFSMASVLWDLAPFGFPGLPFVNLPLRSRDPLSSTEVNAASTMIGLGELEASGSIVRASCVRRCSTESLKEIGMSESPRLIGRKEAAAYCGDSPSSFSAWVSAGKMPPPIPGTRKWDKKAIDAHLNQVGVGVVRAGGTDHRGFREWFVTEEGRAEIKSADTFKNWKFR